MTTSRRGSVLRVITRLNVGGPARHALLLTRALAPDFPTTLAAGSPTAAEGELGDVAVGVRRVPLVRQVDPRRDMAAYRSLRHLSIEVKPRIVHTHMAKAGTIGRLVARNQSPRPRIVHTFHGHVLDGYFRPSVQEVFIRVERALARTTDVLVTVSAEIRDSLLDLGIGSSAQYHVIPLGLDLSPFLAVSARDGSLRSELGVDRDTPLVGIVARLVPIKDHATLFRALVSLSGVHLAVLGDGELRRSLEAEATLLGIRERTHFVGWREDVAAAMSDLDAVVLTSRNEGTPVSLIEALAAATPVVATDVGGTRSVVEEYGRLVPPGDPEAVASALRALLSSQSDARADAQRGRAEVERRYGAARLVEDMRALYEDLLVPKRFT